MLFRRSNCGRRYLAGLKGSWIPTFELEFPFLNLLAMASFFLPSSIQKRLLRYALSRLEFLDADVLDVEHLDITWGTRSVLEFRDVPLRLKVLLPCCLLTLTSFHFGIRLTTLPYRNSQLYYSCLQISN